MSATPARCWRSPPACGAWRTARSSPRRWTWRARGWAPSACSSRRTTPTRRSPRGSSASWRRWPSSSTPCCAWCTPPPEKHQLIVQCNLHLSNPVFEVGMDQAVLTLAQRVRLPGFLLLYRDAVRPQVLHYRTYRHGHLEYESAERPGPHLERLIQKHGPELLTRRGRLAAAAVRPGAGAHHRRWCSSPAPPRASTWGRSSCGATRASPRTRWRSSGCWPRTLSQRLLDYNRERIHLSQFFRISTIDELLRDPAYANHLRPQDQEVGILFADINGFTRICEQGFDSPKALAASWTSGARAWWTSSGSTAACSTRWWATASSACSARPSSRRAACSARRRWCAPRWTSRSTPRRSARGTR